ncbi:MAG: hypothetical protein GY861_09990 [bacterium]|nr:hypothetical protein [bacterium]
MKKYLLFTTPTCPNCPEVKDFMKTVKLEGEIVDAASEDGLKKATEFGVMSVPAVIFLDDGGNETARASTVEEINSILKI